MEESNSHGPQYPANGGAKISGDPASGVQAAGSAGGLATANPPTVVSDQATAVSSVTGKPTDLAGTPSANQPTETEAKAGTSSTNRPPDPATAVELEVLSGDMDHMSLKKGQSSGARRRRQQRLRKKQHAASNDSQATGTGLAKSNTDTGTASKSSKQASQAERGIAAAMRDWDCSQGATAAPERRGSLAGKRDLSGRSPEKKNPKRQKPGTPKQTTYKEAVESALQVYVVNSADMEAPLSEEIATHIRQSLIDLIDAEPSSSTAPIPRFNRSGLAQGNFQVACADQASLEWLCATAGKIPPKDGVSFKAVKHSDLPQLKKVSVWIPGPASSVDKVLARLQKQNPTLRTGLWKVQYQDTKPNGQLLVIGVDSFSLGVLKQLEGRAYFELSRVTFKLPGEAEV